MKTELNIGIVGSQFMGRAHSNAWHDLLRYYDLPFIPVMKVACDIDQDSVTSFASRWGWQETMNSWQQLIEREDIHVIDICTPNRFHMPIAVAASRAGKHVICEKPMAVNVSEARQMLEAARIAGVKNMVAFNYRRVPALVLAKQMIEDGLLGKIYHFNAVYFQDWLVDPDFPWTWRHDAELAGSGAHGDMNAHTIDLAHFLIGEIDSVFGEMKIFTGKRKHTETNELREVSVDDAMLFLTRFNNGASGNFMATRFATGMKNFLRIEIFGSTGGIKFNLERMNELEFFSREDRSGQQGYRTILVTEKDHPYLAKWWPPGHIIGWEHTFIHEMGDFMQALADNTEIRPDFRDGLQSQLVLDAVMESAAKGTWIKIRKDQ